MAEDDGVPEAAAAAAAAACIANSSLCSVAGLYWFDDLYDCDEDYRKLFYKNFSFYFFIILFKFKMHTFLKTKKNVKKCEKKS